MTLCGISLSLSLSLSLSILEDESASATKYAPQQRRVSTLGMRTKIQTDEQRKGGLRVGGRKNERAGGGNC